MIPFMEPKKLASVIVAKRKPDGNMEVKGEEGEMMPEVMMIAEDLIRAVHDKDASAVAEALEAAFMHFDSEPHVEGEHLEEEV
jgi:hypothetical protein